MSHHSFLLIQKQIHRIGMNILPNSKRLLGTHFCSVSLAYSFAKTKVGFLMEGSVDFFPAHWIYRKLGHGTSDCILGIEEYFLTNLQIFNKNSRYINLQLCRIAANEMILYTSVSQPVCRDAQVCRRIFQVCHQILNYHWKYLRNVIVWSLNVTPNFFLQIRVPRAQKGWELLLYVTTF